MKRKLLLILSVICLGIITCFTLFVYKPKGTGNTIEEAIIKSGRIPLKIIQVEKVNRGAIVFFIKNSLEFKKADVACGFVKKTIWGWNWVNGGEHGSLEFYSSKNGLSSQYLPKVNGTPFPLYFGVITNPDVKRIYVLERGTNIKINEFANIIKNNYINMWYVYMDKFKGSKFEIYGLAENYRILNCIKEDITPYYAHNNVKINNNTNITNINAKITVYINSVGLVTLEEQHLISKKYYPINKNGQTYGPNLRSIPSGVTPDLIEAIGVNGKLGYIKNSDINANQPRNPKEAVKYMKKKGTSRVISLYAKDGQTVIDTFKLEGSSVGN